MGTLLVVDDDDLVREIVTDFMNPRGHSVLYAKNGKEGLELVVKNPNLIILDFDMPIMNGYEFSRAIKTDPSFREFAKIPIVGIGTFPETMGKYLTEDLKDKIEIYDFLMNGILRYGL